MATAASQLRWPRVTTTSQQRRIGDKDEINSDDTIYGRTDRGDSDGTQAREAPTIEAKPKHGTNYLN